MLADIEGNQWKAALLSHLQKRLRHILQKWIIVSVQDHRNNPWHGLFEHSGTCIADKMCISQDF